MIQTEKSVSKKTLKRSLIAVITAVFIFSILVTIAPAIGPNLGIPSWPELFKSAGLRDNSDASQAAVSVHFIDVGQGDCILVKTENGNALIDSGDRGNSDMVIRYLRNHNAEDLDYVFITHPDSDHIGSMPEIMENISVSKIIMPDIATEFLPTTKIYEKLLNTISSLSIGTVTAKQSDIYMLGDVSITVVGPISSDSDMNNMSLVLRVVYGNNSFLLTGDAEAEEENEIITSGINIKSDVLKAGHHGSKSSSDERFLRTVMPETVIISCGRDNSFGHPNIEALDRFSNIGAEILRTDFYGTISFTSDGEKLQYYLERNGQ